MDQIPANCKYPSFGLMAAEASDIVFQWQISCGAEKKCPSLVLQQIQIRIESCRESRSELVNKRGLTGFITPRRCLSVDLGRHSQRADGINTCVVVWVLSYFEDFEHKPLVHNKQTCKQYFIVLFNTFTKTLCFIVDHTGHLLFVHFLKFFIYLHQHQGFLFSHFLFLCHYFIL